MPNIKRINDYLQTRLRQESREEVSAVKAAAWLDSAELLSDRKSNPGQPLRDLLRLRVIKGQQKRPNSRDGRWWIRREDSWVSPIERTHGNRVEENGGHSVTKKAAPHREETGVTTGTSGADNASGGLDGSTTEKNPRCSDKEILSTVGTFKDVTMMFVTRVLNPYFEDGDISFMGRFSIVWVGVLTFSAIAMGEQFISLHSLLSSSSLGTEPDVAVWESMIIVFGSVYFYLTLALAGIISWGAKRSGPIRLLLLGVTIPAIIVFISNRVGS